MPKITLEEFLKTELSEGKIDFIIRAYLDEFGVPRFYIHPHGENGKTVDFAVDGNKLLTISEIGVEAGEE